MSEVPMYRHPVVKGRWDVAGRCSHAATRWDVAGRGAVQHHLAGVPPPRRLPDLVWVVPEGIDVRTVSGRARFGRDHKSFM